MQQHINSTGLASFLQGMSIWLYLSQNATAWLVVVMVISPFDYCYSVFTSRPDHSQNKYSKYRIMQHGSWWRKKYEIIKSRNFTGCQYKIMTHFEGFLPPCLFSSLHTYEPSCSLWSSKFQISNAYLSGWWETWLVWVSEWVSVCMSVYIYIVTVC